MSCAPESRESLFSCSIPSFPKGSAAERIQESGRIRIGVVPDTPGFCQWNPVAERLEGLDADLCRLLAQGIFGGTFRSASERVDFVEIPLSAREQALEEGLVDAVVAMYSISDARRERVDFTRPYFGTTLSVMACAQRPVVEPEQLSTRRVCVVENTLGQEYAQLHNLGSSVLVTGSDRDMIDAVSRGDADVAISSSCVLENFDVESPGVFMRPPWSLASLPYAVGVSKGNDSLRDALDNRLDDLLQQGSLVELARRRAERCDPQRIALGA